LSALPSRRANRSFGLVVGGILAAFGLWWLYRGKFPSVAPFVAGVGVLLAVLGAAAPGTLTVPNRLWMRFGEALSFVMTRVVLAIVFYLVVTPIGWIRKATGGDPLRRRGASGETYWHPYPARQRDTKHYEKMY
jgi:hypothetical protein